MLDVIESLKAVLVHVVIVATMDDHFSPNHCGLQFWHVRMKIPTKSTMKNFPMTGGIIIHMTLKVKIRVLMVSLIYFVVDWLEF